MADALLQIGAPATFTPSQLTSPERVRLERRAKTLAWGGNVWHLIEFAIAMGAGVVAGSVALIGFGADSLIEFAAGTVIVWLFTGGRGSSEGAERRAQQLIAASYFRSLSTSASNRSATLRADITRRRVGSGSAWPRSPHRRCRCWHARNGESGAN